MQLATPSDAEGRGIIAAPPLDYSWKELKSCIEIDTEEPRGGKRRPHTMAEREAAASAASSGGPEEPAVVPAATGDATTVAAVEGNEASAAAAGSGLAAAMQLRVAEKLPPMTPRRLRKVTTALKLNNNSLETLQDLPPALELVMEEPFRNLQWIDLSWNGLTKIDDSLLGFKQLKALYLHKNKIKKLPTIDCLKVLPGLLSLTLNGNPIEERQIYRQYVVGALPKLRVLDHVAVTEEQVFAAGAWFKAHLKRLQIRKVMLEEARLDLQD